MEERDDAEVEEEVGSLRWRKDRHPEIERRSVKLRTKDNRTAEVDPIDVYAALDDRALLDILNAAVGELVILNGVACAMDEDWRKGDPWGAAVRDRLQSEGHVERVHRDTPPDDIRPTPSGLVFENQLENALVREPLGLLGPKRALARWWQNETGEEVVVTSLTVEKDGTTFEFDLEEVWHERAVASFRELLGAPEERRRSDDAE
jgi:hypothetical protein